MKNGDFLIALIYRLLKWSDLHTENQVALPGGSTKSQSDTIVLAKTVMA